MRKIAYCLSTICVVFAAVILIYCLIYWCDTSLLKAEGTLPLTEVSPTISNTEKVKEKKVDINKGIVAFVEINSSAPSTVYLMYPAQYEKYMKSGSPESVLEFKDITWLFYPIPALLEDQTVYFVTKGDVAFNITYENIQERIDRLFSGEEQVRAGTEMLINKGINVVRLTQLIPGLKVTFDFFSKSEFVVIKTIDLARYRKGIKGFDQLSNENELKGSNDHFNFTTSDFDDRYLLIRTENPGKLKYIIRATKESAESGC